jgi:hypothetical protein
MSLTNTPMADSLPARYLSFPGARRMEKIWRNRCASRGRRGPVPAASRRHRASCPEDQVEALQHVQVDPWELLLLRLVQGGEVRYVPPRVQVHLERPAGGVGHERQPAGRAGDHARPVRLLRREHLAEQAGPRGGAVPFRGADHPHRPGRHERVGVDLPVRVRERGVVVGGEADHLAPPDAEPPEEHPVARPVRTGLHDRGLHAVRQRREAVLEDDDVVVVGGDLGQPARGGRAQRALVRRREVGAGLPVAGDHHPLVPEHVVADLRRGAGRVEVT